MENDMSIFDKLFDENNSDRIVLYNNKGEALEFEQVAVIPIEGKIYAILTLITPADGISSDDCYVFEICDDGEQRSFNLVHDDELCDEVLAVYMGLVDLLESEEAEDRGDGELTEESEALDDGE